MRVKTRHIVLAAFFILYFSVRLYFSLQSDYFSSESSYFALRQIENIAKTGKPLFNDSLSFGGRAHAFMPGYYYFLAIFTLFLPKIIALKVINNLLASSIIIAVYLVCSKVIKNRKVSLLCAFISGMIPIYISETLNNLSVYSVLIPGAFFTYWLFAEAGKSSAHMDYLVLLTIFLIMSTPYSFLIILGILIFLAISYIEKIEIQRVHLEYLSFFMFFFLWVNFLMYKAAFQSHGFSIIWGNAPEEVLLHFFKNIDIFGAIASIGILPLIFGVYTIYNYLMKKNDRNILIYISLFLAAFILFWSKLIAANLGLIFMGTSLVILMGQSVSDFFSSLRKTKLAGQHNLFFIILVFLLIVTQVVPGIYAMVEDAKVLPDNNYAEGFAWLRQNTGEDNIVLSIPEEGALINYLGNRKNVIDMSFILIKDPQTISDDVEKIFTQKFRIEALRVIEKYNVDYILFSEKTKIKYGLDEFQFGTDRCFSMVFRNPKLEIYKVNKDICELKRI